MIKFYSFILVALFCLGYNSNSSAFTEDYCEENSHYTDTSLSSYEECSEELDDYCVDEVLPYADEFTPYNYTASLSWNTDAFESYQYAPADNMHFRLLRPNGYTDDGSKKYPLILFFHGSGERGTDNEKQLYFGGPKYKSSVDNNTFPGFLLYPQHNSSGANWGESNVYRAKVIVEKLISDYNVDPNRIYIHGISAGARAAWMFGAQYPELTAGICALSGITSYPPEEYKFIPAWESQGGKDNDPTPYHGNKTVSDIRSVGGNIRYSYFPDKGHNNWGLVYSKSDFFPWFLQFSKLSITVLYGQNSFCNEGEIDVNIGITSGFSDYQWAKDNTSDTPIATGVNEINVVEPGLYYVRFKRNSTSGWTEWSEPVNINGDKAPSPTPTINNNERSLHLPSLDGSQNVTLYGPADKAFYQWKRNGVNISGATNQNYTTSVGGVYSLVTREPSQSGFEADGETPTEYRAEPTACYSNPSNELHIVTSNGLGSPARPSNFFANTISSSSIKINWDDNSSNETGFELYRSTTSGSSYTLIGILSANNQANPVSYTDTNLKPNTTYYYQMRAVNNEGASGYTAETSAITIIDTEPPSAPVLSVTSFTESSVGLSWTPSTDNNGVTQYEVYRNGSLTGTTSSTRYTSSGLQTKTNYTFKVRAKDYAGNISPFSNQVQAATINDGLNYDYYEFSSNINSVNDITDDNYVSSGNIANVSFSPATSNNNFALIFNGYIQIPVAGNYIFYTESDDGSDLFIDGNIVVNNDGGHGCKEVNGSVTLSAGSHAFKVRYFQNGSGKCLNVRWSGPGLSKSIIPDEAFEDDFTFPTPPTNPSSLTATATGYNSIDITWEDNSSTESAFEIYRSLSSNGTYTVVYTAEANQTSWTDTGLEGNTAYFYKIKAINSNSSSEFAGPASATTDNYPAAPSAPENLAAVAVSNNRINLTWDSNSTGETGFEVYRTTSTSGLNYTLIATTEANATSYSDNQLFGNNTYYYKIRAIGPGSSSNYSNQASATTANSAPILSTILNRSVQYGTSIILNIEANDPDGDALTFTFTNPLPSFASFDDNGYGVGELTLAPQESDQGVYNLELTVSDGLNSDNQTFTITVNNNNNPVITAIDNVTMDAGYIQTVPVVATDVEDTAIELTLIDKPSWASIVSNGDGTGTITLSPSIMTSGSYILRVAASDTDGGITERDFNVTINPVNPYFSLNINFTASNEPIDSWNNVSFNNALEENLVTAAGTATDIDIAYTTQFPQGRDTDPNLTNGIYENAVIQSFIQRKNGETFTMELRNLNPSLLYDFSFYSGASSSYIASSNVSDPNWAVRYSINGVNRTLSIPDNTTQTANFTGIKPTTDGVIVMTVTRTTGTWITMNAMVVNAYYNDGTPPTAPSDLSLTALSSNSVKIDWIDQSTNETKFEILRASNESGPYSVIGTTSINSNTYTDSGLSGSSTYYYKVRAVNPSGTAETNFGIITTLNSAPTLADLSDIVIKANQTRTVNISAVDQEGNPITLSSEGLPDFVNFQDNGDGTGELFFTPEITDLGFYGNSEVTATDNFNASNTSSFFITVVDPQFEQQVYININNANNATLPWNNLSANPSSGTSYNNLKNAENQNSGFGISVGSGWSGSNNNGVVSEDNSLMFEDNVFRTAWYTSSTASVKLTGLDASKSYNVNILASINTYNDHSGNYTISGTTKKFNASYNNKSTVSFEGLSPSVAGEITITAAKATGSTAALLNALIIKEFDGTNLITPGNFTANATSRTDIKLSWEDNSVNETGFEIYRANQWGGTFQLITSTSANVTEYTDSGLTANTPYVYKIRAVNTSIASGYSPEAGAITYDHYILLNFNTNLNGYLQAPSPWNNTNALPEAGVTINNLTDDSGDNTTVDFIIGENEASSNKTGVVTGDNSGIYPDAVLQGYYYFEPYTIPTPFTFAQMNSDYVFDFTFIGSEDGTYTTPQATGIAEYTINETTVILLANSNSQNTVTINSVKPDADGSITVYAKCSDQNNATWGFLNGMVIGAHTSLEIALDETPPSIPKDLLASNIDNNNFDLSWTPSTDNVGIKHYEVYQNGELINTTPEISLNIAELSPSFEYVYSVRAVDKNGNKSDFSESLEVNTLSSGAEIVYYPVAAADITVLSNWGTETDGSGTNPSSFSAANQHFMINKNVSLNSSLTITGEGSKMMVDENVILDINAALAAALEASANSTININTDTAPKLGKLDRSSTVVFSGSSNTIPIANYGNISLNSTSSTKNLMEGDINVYGNLSIAEDVILNGAAPNSTVISIKGDLNLVGAHEPQDESQLITYRFNNKRPQVLSTDQANLSLYKIIVSDSSQLTINSDSPNFDIHLGASSGGGLSISAGASLNLNDGNLYIQGSGSINPNNELGTISTSGGLLNITTNSAENSNLYFNPTANTLSTLKVDKSGSGTVNAKSTLQVRDLLHVVNGRLNTNGNLILLSTNETTANVGPIIGSGFISGSVEAQRYIPGYTSRIWRYLTSSVQGTSVADLQEFVRVTGDFEGSNNRRQDASLYRFTNGAWEDFPTTTNSELFEVGRGYTFYNYAGRANLTLKFKGPLVQGSFNYAIQGGTESIDDGWNLLGNPYMSTIQWGSEGWTRSDVGISVAIKDNINGDFIYWDTEGLGDSSFAGRIASGQSFWVQASSANATLSINENAKSFEASEFHREGMVLNNYLIVKLSSTNRTDKAYIKFNSNDVDEYQPLREAMKQTNQFLNLSSLSSDGLKLAINKMSSDFCDKHVQLDMAGITNGQYTLNFEELNTFENYNISLLDRYNSSSTPILSEDTEYTFAVTTDEASRDSKRFVLIFERPEISTTTDFSFASGTTQCSNNDLDINIQSAQIGVIYSVWRGSELLAESSAAESNSATVTVPSDLLVSGNNSFSIKANFPNCEYVTITDEATINLTPTPSLVVESEITTCSDSDITLTARGLESKGTYRWFNDESSDTPIHESAEGSYTYTSNTNHILYVESVNEYGCTSDRKPIKINVEQIEKPEIIVNGQALKLAEMTSGNIQWYINDNAIAGAKSHLYTPKVSGSYKVKVSGEACSKVSDSFDYYVTGVNNTLSDVLSIYPNPASKSLFIEQLIPTKAHMQIINMIGETILEKEVDASTGVQEVSVENLKPALYLVKITLDNKTYNYRFVKQ
ncbi:fibronectin type III domain-containing protein [Fulvivirga sediminis]|uniref:Fibronectin type III domain-containing protein n=1 Tax=Fulvivirga sediminis TaxID=2803949 RepID=A0A937K2B4_9BACT|nr:fibronectin type III domain-containing protein [Fulvivirga sediminis]MBL3658195.1 fibronectin type III domain-containing protein [Fulvivirga sediminis]